MQRKVSSRRLGSAPDQASTLWVRVSPVVIGASILVAACDDGVGYPIRASRAEAGRSGMLAGGSTALESASTSASGGVTASATPGNGGRPGSSPSGGTSATASLSSGGLGGTTSAVAATGGTANGNGGAVAASGGTASLITETNVGGAMPNSAGGSPIGGSSTRLSAMGGRSQSSGTNHSGGSSADISGTLAGAPAFCTDAQPWPAESTALELEMLNDINVLRESGYACAGKPAGAPAPPLRQSDELRCAARSVVVGVIPPWTLPGEVLAVSEPSNVDVLALLGDTIGRDMDCSILMDPRNTSVGIAFGVRPFDDSPGYWAIEFGGSQRRPN